MTANTTTVTGHSDDCIEFDGAIYDEHSDPTSGPTRITFDNGVVLDIEWDRDRDGIWRISVIAGHDHVNVTPCPDPTGADIYTDSAVVSGARSVSIGDEFTATART